MRVFLGCKLWLSQQRAVKEHLPWTDKLGLIVRLGTIDGAQIHRMIDHRLALKPLLVVTR